VCINCNITVITEATCTVQQKKNHIYVHSILMFIPNTQQNWHDSFPVFKWLFTIRNISHSVLHKVSQGSNTKSHNNSKTEIILIYMQQDATLHSLFFWKLLYIFRVVPSPIIRSANKCIYSMWYLSHRYCYLPPAADSR
jgi:hypothetical protein